MYFQTILLLLYLCRTLRFILMKSELQLKYFIVIITDIIITTNKILHYHYH